MAASLLVHGAVLAWVIQRTQVETIGGGGQELESVAIEVVASTALESLSYRASAATAGSAGAVSDALGSDAPEQMDAVAVVAAEREKRDEAEEKLPPAPDLVATPLPELEPLATLIVRERVPPPADKPADTPNTTEKPDRTTPEAQPTSAAPTSSQEQIAMARGGAMARSSTASADAEGAAGASQGDLARYALAVRLALGRGRPAHIGAKGKVIVWFRLSTGGLIEAVDLVSASGSASIDHAAIASVRAALFPKPPAGATATQRTYTVPFDFR